MTGEILKQRREALGLDIKQVADLLKIRSDYLVAIENDMFEKLPVPVYTMGYIRCYAKYLALDDDEIIKYYTQHLSVPKPATIIPIAYSYKRTPAILYFVLIVIAVSGTLAVYLSLQHRGPDNPLPEPAKTSYEPPVYSGEKAVPAEIHAGTHEHTLQIDARDVTWLSIRFIDGTAEDILMRPGNSKTVTFSEKVSLKIGNAGGINVILNGKEIGPPGKPGQVVTISYPVEN